MTVKQLKENMAVVLAKVVDMIPRKRKNVATIFLKVPAVPRSGPAAVPFSREVALAE